MCTSYSSLHYLNYSRSLATKSAGMAGRNGGVLVRRSEVEAVITIRRIARLSMRDAFRVFAARAKIAPLLSGDSGA